MDGSGGVSRLCLDMTMLEFNVSTKILRDLLNYVIVNPSLNSMSSSRLRIITGSMSVAFSAV